MSTALEEAGITAALSGGGAVSVYTQNEFESYDLDFVTLRYIDDVRTVMSALDFDFVVGSRYFTHSQTEFVVEFPTGPLAFGLTEVDMDETNIREYLNGVLRIITPTQAVMDRMAAFYHWNDNQSRQQAIRVIRNNEIDWSELNAWAEVEGIDRSVIEKLKADSMNG
ncbi:MAG: hypothetical protein FWD93_05880 [Coriobacteriia bacterium]|nr:hypothetical protein [Coriobacteriia bacterium]